MTEKEPEAILLESARNQEKEYNLFEAAKYYEQAAESFPSD